MGNRRGASKVVPPTSFTSPTSSTRAKGREGGVRLDWRAYFYSFCEVHGEPVEYKGRLLFRDGWMYSMSDYEGPEFPPPVSHKRLDKLVLQYWTIRKSALTRLILKLRHELKVIQDAQATRSLPLQQVTIVEEDQRRVRTSKPLDTSALESKIEWIEMDLDECEERLREIKEYNQEGGEVA